MVDAKAELSGKEAQESDAEISETEKMVLPAHLEKADVPREIALQMHEKYVSKHENSLQCIVSSPLW